MEMFLVIILTSFPILVLGFLAAYGIKNPAKEKAEEKAAASLPERNVLPLAQPAPRFFAGDFSLGNAESRYPVEVLRRQLEAHVRLEQAAAESFLDVPTRETLHSRTVSPFMN